MFSLWKGRKMRMTSQGWDLTVMANNPHHHNIEVPVSHHSELIYVETWLNFWARPGMWKGINSREAKHQLLSNRTATRDFKIRLAWISASSGMATRRFQCHTRYGDAWTGLCQEVTGTTLETTPDKNRPVADHTTSDSEELTMRNVFDVFFKIMKKCCKEKED